MTKMKGVIVPTITPFTKDDKIDTGMIEKLVDYLVKNGVDSVYPEGTTGEMLKQSVEERKLVAETTLAAAKGRIPVFVHTGAATLKDTVELSTHACKIGAAGIGVVTPQFYGVNHREMVNYYVTVSKALPDDFPVYLYNIPQCSGNNITVEEVNDILAQTKNVVGIKYSWADFNMFNQYIACGEKGKFDFLAGPDKHFLATLAIGGKGVISGCAQCYPAPFVNVYKYFLAGDLERARREHEFSNEFATIVRAGANMAYFKAALEYNGLGKCYMRLPALDLTKEEKSAFFAQLDAFHKKYDK